MAKARLIKGDETIPVFLGCEEESRVDRQPYFLG